MVAQHADEHGDDFDHLVPLPLVRFAGAVLRVLEVLFVQVYEREQGVWDRVGRRFEREQRSQGRQRPCAGRVGGAGLASLVRFGKQW